MPHQRYQPRSLTTPSRAFPINAAENTMAIVDSDTSVAPKNLPTTPMTRRPTAITQRRRWLRRNVSRSLRRCSRAVASSVQPRRRAARDRRGLREGRVTAASYSSSEVATSASTETPAASKAARPPSSRSTTASTPSTVPPASRIAAAASAADCPVVITTGQSAADAAAAIREAGGTVLGVLAVVDREEGGRAALEAAGVSVEALVATSELL